jgi:tRNA U34 5-carboxymethylaminomethyl modifying GTPase MnmE/TrmE
MDLTDIHRALERLDAVLAAAQAALDEDPALPEARQAYLEAYAEARSAQGHSARAATTGRLAAARDALTHLEQTQAKRREDVRTQVHRAAELLEAAQAALLKAERQVERREAAAVAARDLLQAEHDAAAAKAAALRHLLHTLGEGL